MHYAAIATFLFLVIPMGGFFLWFTVLAIWPRPENKTLFLQIPCATFTGGTGCWILAAAAGRLWWLGLCTALLLFTLLAAITPAGRHHRGLYAEELPRDSAKT